MRLVKKDSRLLSEIVDHAFSATISDLEGLSHETAYATFGAERPSDTVVVCFCGWNERFRSLAMLRGLGVPAMIVQDPHAPWFTGSSLCVGLDEVADTARRMFPAARRWVFAGQSSGGYAALRVSRGFPGSLTIALAPQTFDDSPTKRAIAFPPGFAVSATPTIADLRPYFQVGGEGPCGSAWLLVAYAESANPPQSYFWIDALHWSRLVDCPGVRVVMLDQDFHYVAYRHSRAFAGAIASLAEQPDWSDAAVEPVLREWMYNPVHKPGNLTPTSAFPPLSEALQALGSLGALLAGSQANVAVRLIDCVIAGHRHEPLALHVAGTALRTAGHGGLAIRYFEAALALEPSFRYSTAELASIFSEQGQVDLASSYFAAALKADANDRHIATLAAGHEARNGRLDDARAILQRVCDGDPAASWAWEALARFMKP